MNSPTRFRAACRPLTLLAVGLLIAGCGIFSPDETKDPPVDTGGGEFVPATTPDLVMQNFQNAWEQLNFAEYSKLLATEYTFYFDPADELDAYVGGPSWSLQDELASVQAMFSNQSGVDPVTEEVIPPIVSIEFTSFLPLDPDWQDPGSEELYAGTVRQRYRVSMRVTYQGEALTTLVSGVNYFYVAPIEVDGEMLWQIKIWEDRGNEGGT
jgi:hypothetical protein